MNWTKKGLIFSADGKHEWNKTHAQVPVVDMLNDKIWRIYYSTRNSQNRSNCSFIEVEAGNPTNILYQHTTPILELGRRGTFDDSGIMPSCIVNVGSKKYLYYIGWTEKVSVPYHNSIGVAESTDGGVTFKKLFEGPIITTTRNEHYFHGTSFVMQENNIWKMWYLACTKWEIANNKPEPYYHLKYAESQDGIDWKRDGIVAIDYASKEEGGIVSASVIREKEKYRMWFACRKAYDYRTDKHKSYRIGYAESADGIVWNRQDELAGIDVSESGWDSEMIAYPYVINYKDTLYMFYNGNGFGKSGIGYAVLKK